MTIEINLVVVAIIFSIIAIMAIIGYLVEGSNTDNKKKDKKKDIKQQKTIDLRQPRTKTARASLLVGFAHDLLALFPS